MNAIERRMLNEVGLNFIENIDKWRLVRNIADALGFELTLFKSSGRYRYALYLSDNMGRPRNSRSNRVMDFQEVLAPHSCVKEDMVFDYYIDIFFQEYFDEEISTPMPLMSGDNSSSNSRQASIDEVDIPESERIMFQNNTDGIEL